MKISHILLTAVLSLAGGFAGAALWSFGGFGHGDTRAYLLDNPEILPEMAEAYQRAESAGRLAEVQDEALTAFPGAVLGNPTGSKTLVEFSDYGCTYCRSSVENVRMLIAADPDLKVIVREWPIFDGSDGAARMALAAAKQGKFEDYHFALFSLGPPSPSTVEQAARIAGLDLDQARKDASSPEIEFELARNQRLARAIGFSGTPSWIAEGQVFEGAVPRETLAEALEASAES